MYQLRNLISRTSVPGDPQKNMNSAEDFMLLLVHAHVIVAAKKLIENKPHNVTTLSKEIVDSFVCFPNTEESSANESDIKGLHDDTVHLEFCLWDYFGMDSMML